MTDRCGACGVTLKHELLIGGQCPACLLSLASEASTGPDQDETPPLMSSCRVLNALGAGPRGATYLAEDHSSRHRLLVLKVFAEKRGDDQRESIDVWIESLARLVHPYIVPVVGGGLSEQGQPFVISEYVAGVSLRRHCDRVVVSREGRARLLADVAEAVDYAHARGAMHGHLVADNVIVSPSGSRHIARLVDFGLPGTGDAQSDLESLDRLRSQL